MLRDEGGRLADEDSQVFIGAAPAPRNYDLEFDDDSPPVQPVVRPDVPAKPAVVVGLAQAQAARANNKRSSDRVAAAPRVTAQQAAPPPPPQPPQLPLPPPAPRSRQMNAVAPSVTANVVPAQPRRPLPAPFNDEPTRQVDDELLTALRNAPPAKPSPRRDLPRPSATAPRPSASQAPPPRSSAMPPPLPRSGVVIPAAPDDPTRMAHIDSLRLDDHQPPSLDIDREFDRGVDHGLDELTRPADDFPPRFLQTAPTTDPGLNGELEDHRDPEEATRLASIDGIAAMERARRGGPSHDERTRAVNIRNDPSISDIDWDLD
jgi:hypothetical protein